MTSTTIYPGTSTARGRGRPILGAISGLLLGLFVFLDLLVFGVIGLDSILFWILPVAGIALGMAMGVTAPFQRRG